MNIEQTIDRSLDQTAPHVHAKGAVCPTCLIANSGDEVEPQPETDPERESHLNWLKQNVAILALRKRIEKVSSELTEIAEKMKTL